MNRPNANENARDTNAQPRSPEASTEGSTREKSSRPASHEERLGEAFNAEQGENIADQPEGEGGEFGSQAPFGGGPKKGR